MKRLLVIILLMTSVLYASGTEYPGKQEPERGETIRSSELKDALRQMSMEERRMLRDQLRQELRQSMGLKKGLIRGRQ